MAFRATVLLLFALNASGPAQTRMTVADVDALLSSRMHAEELADRLTSMELTERVTPDRLARWQAAIKDPKARMALLAIADLSAFRPLSAADISTAPSPGESAQQRMLARATEYTRAMIPRLPNFSAERLTTRFEFATRADLEREEATLQSAQMSRARMGYRPLASLSKDRYIFLLGERQTTVTYRDGSEVTTPEAEDRRRLNLYDPGLISSGEFGSILQIVDKDASAGTLRWDHWEQGQGKLLAVFRYAVPHDKSHFAVYTPPVLFGMHAEKHTPAYHGEISINPEDGAINRITVEADSEASDADLPSAVAVEYTATEIGGRTYVLPVHAVAVMSRREENASATGEVRRYVNDTRFVEYHLFRSDARIVPEKAKTP